MFCTFTRSPVAPWEESSWQSLRGFCTRNPAPWKTSTSCHIFLLVVVDVQFILLVLFIDFHFNTILYNIKFHGKKFAIKTCHFPLHIIGAILQSQSDMIWRPFLFLPCIMSPFYSTCDITDWCRWRDVITLREQFLMSNDCDVSIICVVELWEMRWQPMRRRRPVTGWRHLLVRWGAVFEGQAEVASAWWRSILGRGWSHCSQSRRYHCHYHCHL